MTSHVRTTKADLRLADQGRQYRAAKAEAKAADENAKALQSEILAELGARGVESVTVDGLEIKRRESVTRTVDLAKLLKLVGTRIYKTVTKVVVNTGTWNAAINDGLITPDVLAKVETTEPKAPWIEATELA